MLVNYYVRSPDHRDERERIEVSFDVVNLFQTLRTYYVHTTNQDNVKHQT